MAQRWCCWGANKHIQQHTRLGPLAVAYHTCACQGSPQAEQHGVGCGPLHRGCWGWWQGTCGVALALCPPALPNGAGSNGHTTVGLGLGQTPPMCMPGEPPHMHACSQLVARGPPLATHREGAATACWPHPLVAASLAQWEGVKQSTQHPLLRLSLNIKLPRAICGSCPQ